MTYVARRLASQVHWTPGRSTLLNILTGCFFVIEPLLAYFKRTLQTDSVIGCDDTGVNRKRNRFGMPWRSGLRKPDDGSQFGEHFAVVRILFDQLFPQTPH